MANAKKKNKKKHNTHTQNVYFVCSAREFYMRNYESLIQRDIKDISSEIRQ